MSDLSQLQKKQNQTFMLALVNFVLFMVLFTGLGYLAWQSARLVNQLQADLDRAEQTIADLQDRFQNMDTGQIVDRLVASATEQLGESIRTVVQASALTDPIERASEKLAATGELLADTGQAIEEIHETIKGVDSEEIARLVSYHLLKGLGDGFQEAAESRKPDFLNAPQASARRPAD